MPSEVFGLPVHPLAVHLPVVLVPFLAAVVLAYVLVPRLRRPTGWLLVGLSVLTPLAVLGAYLSGQNLAEATLADMQGEFAAKAEESISAHAGNAVMLLWLTIAAAVLSWVFAGYASGRLPHFLKHRSFAKPSDDAAPAAGRSAVLSVSGALLVGLAVAMVFFVVRAGHTGAGMVWGA